MSKTCGALTNCLLAVLLAGVPAFSDSKWEKIGSEKVSRKSERDAISVDKDKNYRFIQLRVLKGPVNLEEWTFEFADGSTLNLGIFGYVVANTTSRPIPVKPGLSKIRFKYNSAGSRKRSKVEVWGFR